MKLKVKTIYKFPNTMVIAFDEDDQQIPELQGHIWDVIGKLKPYLNDKQLTGLTTERMVEIHLLKEA